MIITSLEKVEKNKIRVYIDGIYVFFLYTSDLKKYHLKENQDLSENLYQKIMEETICVRAKQKLLTIISRMDRTEWEIKEKLKNFGYPEQAVDWTIAYGKEYSYINDERYARQYISYKKRIKSQSQMKMELTRKGIDKAIAEQAFACQETEKGQDGILLTKDQEAIENMIQKKTDNIDTLSWKEKQKLASFLYRKGFLQEDIHRYIHF